MYIVTTDNSTLLRLFYIIVVMIILFDKICVGLWCTTASSLSTIKYYSKPMLLCISILCYRLFQNNVIVTQPVASSHTTYETYRTSDHYFTLSIILTICCFLCGTWCALFCTIPAIIFAVNVSHWMVDGIVYCQRTCY